MFDLRRKRIVRELRRADFFDYWVTPMAWIPDSYLPVVGSSMESVVYVWNIETDSLQLLKPRCGNTLAITVSPDGRRSPFAPRTVS